MPLLTDEEIRERLENGADLNEWLFTACKDGLLDVTEALIHAGADIHSKDWQGNTPLMKACKCGHADVAKMLVKAGANINDTNEYEQTALLIACKKESNKHSSKKQRAGHYREDSGHRHKGARRECIRECCC